MASPDVMDFQRQKVANARRQIAIRLQQGTKGGSPQNLAKHWARRDFTGVSYYSTGSKTSPFFANTNQRDMPLEAPTMNGGVLRNYRYARFILNRRAKDTIQQELMKQGIPPAVQPPVSLTELETQSLELNTILDELNTAITEGNIASAYLSPPELMRALRLLSAYMVDGMTEEQLVQFKRFFDELQMEAESLQGQATVSNPKVTSTLRWISNVNKLLTEFAKDINESREVKRLRLSKYLESIFKLSKRSVSDALPSVRRRPPVAQQEEVAPEGVESAYSAQTGTTATGLPEPVVSNEDLVAELPPINFKDVVVERRRRRPVPVIEEESDIITEIENARSRDAIFRAVKPKLEEESVDKLQTLFKVISEGETIRALPSDKDSLINRVFNKIKQKSYSKQDTADLFQQWFKDMLSLPTVSYTPTAARPGTRLRPL